MIDALPGDIFSRGQILNNTYEIEGVLGRGGTGEVYRARNQVTGRVVAIKALSTQFSGNDDYVELMRREEQMRDIRDDTVVRYTECSRSDQGHVFLVMDYIDGPSLNEEMAARRIEPRELMIVAHRVAQGLGAAHRQGIVHRDLSPDNVILRGGNPEEAVIIDFGIAKDTAAGARTIVGNDFAGKYEYAAPEQLEGRAEKRSDFYSLGALLLAAYRGAVPFAGATPGEMVRRKQVPLDTEGVPEPLRALIEWLAAPALADRPGSADEIVARLDLALKPKGRTGNRGASDPVPKRRKVGWLAVPAVVLLAAGLYFGAGLDRYFAKPPPVANPYRFAAGVALDGTSRLSGNAPDTPTAKTLAAAFAETSGTAASADTLTLASGMPSEKWPGAVVGLLSLMAGVEGWRVDLSGLEAGVSGIAASTTERRDLERRLSSWATANGFALRVDVAAGPRVLPSAEVASILGEIADCGPLSQGVPEGESYALGDTILISGATAAATTAESLRARLTDAVGDRGLRVETVTLNSEICAVRNVLPAAPSGALSIWFGQGDTGAANLSGAYHVNQNPIVEVHAPADVSEGSLWVVLVDNTGKVFNLLPNINFDEQRIGALGTVENGVRRIRILHSIREFAEDPRLMAMRISESDFGKSEIVAILSKSSLFDFRRPTDESVASFAEALAEIQAASPDNIVAIATRLLDSGP